MKKVFAAEYGILPGNNNNNVKLIDDMIKEVGNDAEIIFSQGTYVFNFNDAFKKQYSISNTFSVDEQTVSIALENLNNITLDFQGSDLLFTGWQTPISIDGCSNINIKNASIDWKTATSAEGTVIDSDTTKITLHIDNELYPHYVSDGSLYFTEEYWGDNAYWASIEYNKETLRIQKGSADKVLNSIFTEIDENTVEMIGYYAAPPLKGNYLALRHGERTQAGVFCQDSNSITFSNVNIYNSCGIAFVFQFSENITMDKVFVVPNYKRGRLVTSAHDDAMQFSNCKGDIVIRGCHYKGMFDDAVNVHGTSSRIKEIRDNVIIGEFMERCSAGFSSYAKKDDVISFINRQTMNSYTTAVVESFALLNEFEFELKFNDLLPSEIRINDAMENITNTPLVLIENCYVGSARARGVLVATPMKTIIKNNVFDTSGSAILLAGDANGWFESGACKDVTISDNIFTEHCLSSEYQFGEAVISLYPIIPEPHNCNGFHNNICIINNNFTVSDRRVLYALGSKGISFKNNTIVSLERSSKNTSVTRYDYCSDIHEDNNHIIESFPSTACKEIKIAFLGDSITEGCFELVKREDDSIEIIRDVEFGYPSLLKQLIETNIPNYSVNIVNAGLSGNTSTDGLARVEKDVLSANPDLVVVCFALNNACLRQPEQYKSDMDKIFSILRDAGLPVIFMTPNMMNTYVHESVLPELINTATECSQCQNDGSMDYLINCGIESANKHGCIVCDCYNDWKEMAQMGIDITQLLCNYINHPTRNLHNLFANKLFTYVKEFLQN